MHLRGIARALQILADPYLHLLGASDVTLVVVDILGLHHGNGLHQTCGKVELAQVGTRQFVVDVVHFAVSIQVAVAATAGQSKGTTVAVDGEGHIVTVIEAGSHLCHLHRLQVDSSDGIAVVQSLASLVGIILVGEVLRIAGDGCVQRCIGEVEQAIDLAVLGVVGHACRLQVGINMVVYV